MELVNKKWEEVNSLAAVEFEHRKVLNKCGYPSCIVTTALHWCPRCQIRQYCCNEHQMADSTSHKRFCRPPIQDEGERTLVRAPGYLPMPFEERKRTIEALVNLLLDSLTNNVYPPENLESVFGIQMIEDSDSEENEFHYVGIDTPVGSVMYGCWMFISKCNVRAYARDIANTGSGGSDLEKMDVEGGGAGGEFDLGVPGEDSSYQFDVSGVNCVNKQLAAEARATLVLEMVQAMLEGRLPAWFRFKVCELDRMWLTVLNQPVQDAYCAEIKRRDFRGIRWNYQALANLAGK